MGMTYRWFCVCFLSSLDRYHRKREADGRHRLRPQPHHFHFLFFLGKSNGVLSFPPFAGCATTMILSSRLGYHRTRRRLHLCVAAADTNRRRSWIGGGENSTEGDD